MAGVKTLPDPHLNARLFGARSLRLLTDDALFEQTGIRIAFSGRQGGVSEKPYASLNLGSHVGDERHVVENNREIMLEALGASHISLILPHQVHGSDIVSVESCEEDSVHEAQLRSQEGADGVVVGVSGVATLLCFADCVPLILASPTGRFAVIHAGWRGVMNGIAPKAVRQMAQDDSEILGAYAPSFYNVYIGPHIHAECFETSTEICQNFVERFGEACAPRKHYVDMLEALSIGLEEVGVVRERIADAGICTKCSSQDYFSYRASGGVCGRHGAFALKEG